MLRWPFNFVRCLSITLFFATLGIAQNDADLGKLLQEAEGKLAAKQIAAAKKLYLQIADGPMVRENAEPIRRANFMLGQFAENQSQYGQALTHYTAAIDVCRKFKYSRIALASSLGKRINIHRRLGLVNEAALDCEEALAALTGAFPPDKKSTEAHSKAAILISYAAIERGRGDFDAAERKYETAVRLYKEFPPSDRSVLAALYGSFAFTLERKGEFSKARRMLESALAESKSETEAQRLDLAIIQHNLGSLLETQGERFQGREAYLKALEILEPLAGDQARDRLVTVKASLGMLEHDLGNGAKSLGYLQEVLATREKIFGSERAHPLIAIAKQNIGRTYLLLDELTQAEQFTRAAIDDQEQLYGKMAPNLDLGKSQLQLAKILLAKGNFDDAIAQSETAHSAYRSIYPTSVYSDGHQELIDALETLGKAFLRDGQNEKAINVLLQASKMQNQLARGFIFTAAEAESRKFADVYLNVPTRLLDAMQTQKKSAEFQYDAILSSRRLIQRSISGRNVLYHELGENESFQKLVSIRRQLNSLASRKGTKSDELEAIAKEMQKLTEEKERLERELQSDVQIKAKIDELQGTSNNITAADLRKVIDDGTALLEIIELTSPDHTKDAQRKYAVFVLTRHTVSRFDLADASAVDAAVQKWLVHLSDSGFTTAEKQSAIEVGKLIWQEINSVLSKDINRLYICPDGLLARIPWVALSPASDGSRLSDRFTISLLPHPQLLLELPSKRPVDWNNVVLVGDVDYAKSSWKKLEGTAKELSMIKESILTKNPKVGIATLSGLEPSVDRVSRALVQSSAAHLATHGFFNEDPFAEIGLQQYSTWSDRNPLLNSSLVLSAENPESQSVPLMTGEEIAALDLRKVDLITLSACDTGRGTVLRGEGTYGLQQAFHIAGVRSILASQWKIADAATVDLMNSFYQQLLDNKKIDPATALALAQRQMRFGTIQSLDSTERGLGRVPSAPRKDTESKPTEVHPYYWASFQHSGL